MAGWFFAPAPPQPATVHVPPNATASTNVPPNPVGPGSLLIRSLWPAESWPTQELIGGGVGALTATPFVPPVAIAATNPTVLAAIRQAWAPEQWAAQRAAQIASFFATVTNPPVVYPMPPAAQAIARSLWPQESWYAQSEAGIASGIAQTQLPPVYQPWSIVPRMALLRSLWLPEDWRAQAGARYAAWIPPPATAIPTVIRHLEIGIWTPDTWGAQAGTRDAAIFAGVPAPYPYVNQWLAAALRSAWPPENWPAQTFPDIASGQSPLTPPVPQQPSQLAISLWPGESWGSQPGTRGAAILAVPQLLVFMPFVVGELRDVAVAQLQALFQPVITLQYVYSGAPPETVVAQSIAAGTLVFPGEALTLQISLGRPHGPAPCPIVESILISNIRVVLPLTACNVKVLH